MKYLTDTHIFLWIILSPKKIPINIQDILIDSENQKFVSVVSFWEIALKFSLGKMDLAGISPDKLPAIAEETGFTIIDVDADTASSFYKLPKIKNKDPFDRMLAWQAICQDCYFITQDSDFTGYQDYGLKII